MQGRWYQERWGNRFNFAGDQNQKTRYENTDGGFRLSTTPGGVGTGEGGDLIICDDPHNVKKAESEAERKSVLLWWDETMQTRVNNPKRSAFIIIMQRLHEEDLSGHVLEEGEYVHLCLPARYEGTPAMVPGAKIGIDLAPPSTFFEDPRDTIGESLFPALWGHEELAGLESKMTSYAKAGQLQQHPSPREGGMFVIDNFKVVSEMPFQPIGIVRYWDKAGTDGGGTATAGVKMGRDKEGRYVVLDVVKGHWSAGKREKNILTTAEEDGRRVKIRVEQEPGSGGKESAENTVRSLEGYSVKAVPVSSDKVVRAEPYAAQLENHGIYILKAPWNKDYIEEHRSAPMGRLKDQWDAAAGAYNTLSKLRYASIW
jgi:predicted phage terminase large subunit-like protein